MDTSERAEEGFSGLIGNALDVAASLTMTPIYMTALRATAAMNAKNVMRKGLPQETISSTYWPNSMVDLLG